MKKRIYILFIVLVFLWGCDRIGYKQRFFNSENEKKEPQKEAETFDKPVENVTDQSIKKLTPKNFFEKITQQVKRDWETDARIYKIHTTISGNEIKKLTSLSCSQPWQIIYISPSRKRMINIFLPDISNNFLDISRIYYAVKNTRTEQKGRAIIKSIRENIEYKMDEEDIAKNPSAYVLSDEWFKDWETDFKSVGIKIYERIKNNVKNTNTQFTLSLYYTGKNGNLAFNSPVWEMKWIDSRENTHYYIIHAVTGEILFDSIYNEAS